MCRSRRELSNEYLLAKFGFDTAENEPLKFSRIQPWTQPRLTFLSRGSRASSPACASGPGSRGSSAGAARRYGDADDDYDYEEDA